jgi:tubulin polyglutamylase complex subunit 2
MQDEISLSVISFLERHAGITDVQYFERPPCAARDIENWERAHYPCVLPEDFKSFLRLSDGLLLKWSIKQNELTQPLGCMQVNDVANLSPCPRGSFAPGEGVFEPDERAGEKPECVAAFELDSTALDGRLALLYTAGALTKPQIWFQDLSATWFFIADTFTDYFRLMMMHLGVPRWHYAFTRVVRANKSLDPFPVSDPHLTAYFTKTG